MPCPHYDINIIQRSNRQSAVAAAAYQSGERLFSEYDGEQKYYSNKSEIVHKEIMLPPHAPQSYADRNTLWNAAEAIEKQWNSQLARRIVLAIPREIPPGQHADLLRDYCREFFVSKGMIADFAIHDKGDGNPHAHILLTMRAMDETGRWLPKSRKVYDLDENGERIRLPSGNWKSHKEDTVDWNDQTKAELWRQGWADTSNRYLEANALPERLDLRSYARQGIDKIPTVHMGAAVSHMEKQGIPTNIGNLNRDIKAANAIMQSIRQMVRSLKGWLADLKEKKQTVLAALEEKREPTLPELLSRNLIHVSQCHFKAFCFRLSHIENFEAGKPVHAEYAAIRWKKPKEQFATAHREELDAYYAAVRYFKAHLEGKRYNPKKLTEEKGQLTEEVASHKAALEAVQADVRILRDVRHWLNQVLPSDQYRQTAEPGKKKSTIGELKGREQRIREERAEKKLPPRTQKQQDMEH